MSYVSQSFILFFAAFLVVYSLMPVPAMRVAVIIAGNVIFYSLAGGRSLLLILAAAAFLVYLVSLVIGRIYGQFERAADGLTPKEKAKLLTKYKKRAKLPMLAGVILLIGFLVFAKTGRLLGLREITDFRRLPSLGFRAVIVPLGISYYTFSAAGYLLDVYWKKAKPEKNFFLLLASMTYFPIIVQGPISRYDRLMKQFRELPGFSYDRVTRGLQRMVWGFFKKLVIADRISAYPSAVFADIGSFAGIEVILAVLANVIHLYMDFSGCMDIVIGAAETMGVVLDENFEQPFFSKGAAEFWRRWHITLGSWFKDYVYMPIATSKGMMKRTAALRKAKKKRTASFVQTAFPLIVVWILTGLWHGTGADYLIWGLYWGVLIIVETTFAPEFRKVTELLRINPASFGHRLFQMIRTLLYFSIGRMITALGSAAGFGVILGRITAENRLWTLIDGSIFTHGLDAGDVNVLVVSLAVVWAAGLLQTKMNIRDRLAKQPLPVRWAVYIAGILAVLIFGVYGPGYSASSFAYGAF